MYGFIALVLPRPDTGFRVEFPDLPGCRCAGVSVEDALARAPRALATYTAALRRRSLAMPAPRPADDMIVESLRLGAVAAACLRAPLSREQTEVERQATAGPRGRLLPFGRIRQTSDSDTAAAG
ncbi:MAG: type II toxin-antitoxin system HicB family antitoxin [Alphaproteobacteria bacterium]|nr:type II toxin-antitoxin system HicB family antitoxin [Alphaproteobacteria bacterium]